MSSEVLVYRGSVLESRHAVSVAVARSDGTLAASSGNPDLVAFWRSCAKPFQAVPSLLEGAAESISAGDEELALACASHNGEPRHVEIAERMLRASGSSERDLVCGPHASLEDATAREMAAAGRAPTRLHNNCSGKHALMIACARHRKWSVETYADAGHPLQRCILDEVATWTSLAANRVPYATDGCGVPSFALPLRAMALAWARIGAAARDARAAGIPGPNAAAMKRLTDAIIAEPFLLAGSRRLDTDLIAATQGRVLAKVGAEGVYCAAIPSMELGVALKIEDGATRALGPALLGVLEQAGAADLPPLPEHRVSQIRNTLGVAVGHIEARVNLDRNALQ